MKMQFHCLLAVGVATLGTVTAINAAVAAADPQVCEPAAGVHECTSPGHAGIHVPAPAPPGYPNFQGGPRGGPPILPWIG